MTNSPTFEHQVPDEEEPDMGSGVTPNSLTEDVRPSGRGVEVSSFLQVKDRARERTRRHLAVGLLVLVGMMALAAEAAYIFGKIPGDGLREVSVLFTPVVTLASAAFGFFFGREIR